jgi:hypothetical protein
LGTRAWLITSIQEAQVTTIGDSILGGEAMKVLIVGGGIGASVEGGS